MRQDPGQLGFIQNQASYTSQTGGPVLREGATRGIVQKEQIDLSGFVQALQIEGEEFRDMVQEAETKIGRRVAEMQEAGMDTDAIVKQLTGGKSDIRNAKKIASEIQKRGLEAVDSPWFQLGLTGRKAQYAMRRYFAGVKADETNMATYAGMIANADAGTRGEKMAEVMAEIQKGAVGVMLEFGTIGQSAAEEAMINEMNSFRSELLGRSRKRQTVQHRQLVQESIADIGDNFINDAFDTETKTWNPDPEEVAKFQNALMIENRRVITEGILNPQEIVDGLRGTAAEIANKFGDKAAAEFLSVAAATENPKNGRDLFQGDLASAIQGDISRFEHRAEQDLEKTQELNGRTRSNAKNLIASTPIGQRMLQAKSPEAVRDIVNKEIERVVEAIENGEDPGYPGAFQGNADLQLFYLDALDEYASEKMQSARTTNVVKRENVEAQVNLSALRGDYHEAYAAISEGVEGGALAASDASSLIAKVEQTKEKQSFDNKNRVWRRMERPARIALTEHFAPESLEEGGVISPAQQEKIEDALQAMEFDLITTVGVGELSEADVIRIATEGIKLTRDEYTSKVRVPGTKIPVTEVMIEGASYTQDEIEQIGRAMQTAPVGAKAIFDLKSNEVTFGGMSRTVIKKSEGGNYWLPGFNTPLRKLEMILEDSTNKPRLGGVTIGPSRTHLQINRDEFERYLKRFVGESKLEDPHTRGAIVGDALGKMGYFNAETYVAIQSGDMEAAKAAYLKNLPAATGRSDDSYYLDSNKRNAEVWFSEQVNLDDVQVFSLRFSDYSNADEYIKVDPVTDAASLKDNIPQEAMDNARQILNAAGLNGDSDALVAKFFHVQQIVWSY